MGPWKSSAEGAILLVSHDRALIDARTTPVWAVSGDRPVVFPGKYSEYPAWRESRPAEPMAEAGVFRSRRAREKRKPPTVPAQKRKKREEAARLQALEEEVARLEEEKVAPMEETERAGVERVLGRLLEPARRYEELAGELGRRHPSPKPAGQRGVAPAG